MQADVSRRILVSTAAMRNPTFSELAAELQLAHSVVAYYLRTLIAQNLLVVGGDSTTRSYQARFPERVRDLDARFGRTFERSISDTIAEVWGGVLKD
jgi:hypothetical protein